MLTLVPETPDVVGARLRADRTPVAELLPELFIEAVNGAVEVPACWLIDGPIPSSLSRRGRTRELVQPRYCRSPRHSGVLLPYSPPKAHFVDKELGLFPQGPYALRVNSGAVLLRLVENSQ